jgi:hypothetical protein
MADAPPGAAPAPRHRIHRHIDARAETGGPHRIVADLLDHVREPAE